MRLYDSTVLAKCSEDELNHKLCMVQISGELTDEEKSKNIELIQVALNGGASYKREDVLSDILAGRGDVDKIGGY